MLPNERPLPHNLEAERAVLGSVLLDPAAVFYVLESLAREDFYSEQNRTLFGRMAAMASEGRTIELVTLKDELATAGELERAGGVATVAALADGLPGGKRSLAEYVRIVKEKASLRRAAQGFIRLAGGALGNTDIDDLIGDAEGLVGGLRDGQNAGTRSAVTLRAAIDATRPMLERVRQSGAMLGSPTGFGGLDEILAGWIPSDLVILAARPSMGKSALARDFAIRQAKQDRPVAIFSLEMSREVLVTLMICREAKVDNHSFRRGYLDDAAWDRMMGAAELLSVLPIWIDDRAGVSACDLRWRMRALAKREGLRLAIVDYLQLATARGGSRYEEVTNVARELQHAAKDLGSISGGTLIALSQLSREAATERPKLHHLRESGEIEQAADVVMFIGNKEPVDNGQADPAMKYLDIAKQRNGPCGLRDMVFIPQWVGFEEMHPNPENGRKDWND